MKTFIKTKHAIALLLIVTAGIPAVLLADSFTPAEKREINVDTPGLFEKSKSFSVDFTQGIGILLPARRRKSVRLYARP